MYIATPLEIFLKIDYFNMYIYQESYELIILYKNSLRTKMSKISGTESNISSRALQQYDAIFICPITQELMVNPSDLPCGHTYQFEEIKKVLEKFGECPLCKKLCSVKQIKKNLFAKQSIQLHLKNLKKKQSQKQKQLLKQMEQLKLAQKKAKQVDLPFQITIKEKQDTFRQNPFSKVRIMLTPKQAAVYDEIIEMQTQYQQQFVESSDSDSDENVHSYRVFTQKVFPVKVKPQNYKKFNKARMWFKENYLDIYLALID